MEGPPRTLSHLRVATVAAQQHFACIQRACAAVDVLREDWDVGPESAPPHLLLIEASGLRQRRTGTGPIADEKVQRARELIAWCKDSGVPTALWVTLLQRRIDTPMSLVNEVDHVFVADPESVVALTEELDGQRPMQLPLAAQVVPETVPGFGERELQVLFFGRWASWFKGPQREQLEMILDVASDHGLVILERPTDREDHQLPKSLSRFAQPIAEDHEAIEQFQNSRVVVGHDPRNHGRLMLSQITLDALAAGSAVIAPENLGMQRLLNYIVIRLKTRDAAEREIARLLGDEEAWSEVSSRCRAAALHAHTYSHRIATMASAIGYSLLPEPERAASPVSV